MCQKLLRNLHKLHRLAHHYSFVYELNRRTILNCLSSMFLSESMLILDNKVFIFKTVFQNLKESVVLKSDCSFPVVNNIQTYN